MGFNPQLADPKTVADSIAKGASEILTFFPRAAENIARNRAEAAADLKEIGMMVKDRMPEDPGVLPEAALRAGASIIKRGIGLVEGVVSAADETVKGVKAQIDRVIK